MRRDRMCQGFTVLLAIGFAVLAAVSGSLPIPAIQPSREAFRTALATSLAVGIGFELFVVYIVQAQRNLFEAALPIVWRDVWLSRALSLLAATWLPLMAAAAFGLPPLPLLEGAAVFTVLILGGTYLQSRPVGSSQRLLNAGFRIVFLALIGAPFIAKQLKRSGWAVWPSPGIVLTVCGLASAIIFWHAWATVPKSLSFAPSESVGNEREANGKTGFTWYVPFRSIFGTPMALMILFLVGNIFSGNLWVAGGVLGLTQVQIRAQCRWLLALPVSRRRLFAWIAIPPAVAIVAACLGSIFLDSRHLLSPKARLLELGLQLGVFFGLIFLSELSAWRRLGRLRVTRFGVWILWTPFVIASLAPMFTLPDTKALQRLADVLPGSSWQPAALLAILAMATYWLAEKAFREQEYRPVLLESIPYRRSSI